AMPLVPRSTLAPRPGRRHPLGALGGAGQRGPSTCAPARTHSGGHRGDAAGGRRREESTRTSSLLGRLNLGQHSLLRWPVTRDLHLLDLTDPAYVVLVVDDARLGRGGLLGAKHVIVGTVGHGNRCGEAKHLDMILCM